jgi:hypothetical protein
MKFVSVLDNATKQRLIREAIAACEAQVFSIFFQQGIDPDAFDETSFAPTEDANGWEIDLKKTLDRIVSLKLELEKLA